MSACDVKLRCQPVIPTRDTTLWYHPVISTCDINLSYQPVIPACDITLWYQPVTSSCDTSLWHQPVIPTCDINLWYKPVIPTCVMTCDMKLWYLSTSSLKPLPWYLSTRHCKACVGASEQAGGRTDTTKYQALPLTYAASEIGITFRRSFNDRKCRQSKCPCFTVRKLVWLMEFAWHKVKCSASQNWEDKAIKQTGIGPSNR